VTEPLLVLNVNDHEATRYLYTQILKRGGYRIVEAATGRGALEVAAAEKPDVVLLDIKLPDLSGLEVCRLLKSDPTTSAMLVVQTSATFASSDRKVEGLDSGADAYLAQPVEPLELLATIRALVRRRSAEEAERRTARKLQKTFDAIKDAVLITDANGRIVQCNEAALRLLEEASVLPLARPVTDALRRIVPAADLHDVLDGARSERREIEVVQPRGRSFRISADPITGEDHAYEGAVVMLTDITAQKQLLDEHKRRNEELAEEARRKDEFLGMLAHELRNPLNAISAANTLLDRLGPPDAGQVRLRNVIHRQTRNLARMVDDLLEVSRINRGKIALRKNRIDLVAIVRQAVLSSQATLDARRQRVSLAVPEGAVFVDGDDLRLEQVVMNLLGNASKYSEPGSIIALTVAERGNGQRHAELRVKDTGVGIPPHMLEKVFEPFVQVDPTLARSLGGLGIGLSMVKSLVELHGGTVVARSGGTGTGTEIVVDLPLASAHEARVSLAPVPSAPAPRVWSILVIEDNDDARELFETWLTMLGHSVQSAGDGRTGCELALTMHADIAFVDIGLPGMDGYEVAKTVRAAGKATYMVAVTGYGRPEDRARALDSGFDDHIVKPLDQHALDSVLRRMGTRAKREGDAGMLLDGGSPARFRAPTSDISGSASDHAEDAATRAPSDDA